MMNDIYLTELVESLGYLSAAEAEFLHKLARSIDKKKPVIVNIGAGAGTSGLTFRLSRPDSDLYTIDISPGGPLGGLEGERNAFDKEGVDYPVQVLGDSKKVGRSWKKEVDLLFVDGDHSEEGIRGDIEAWIPHVKKGGIVAFHDYEFSKWKEVKPVVDKLMDGYEEIDLVDSIMAFRL